MNPPSFRAIPSVEKLLQALGPLGDLPRPVAVAFTRRELAAVRGEVRSHHATVPDFDAILGRVRDALATLRRARIQPVINATGILIHTNLGRAPLAPAAVETLVAVAAGYTNLEYDLVAGERGPRAGYLEQTLALLCESEAATVVNNCAAALVLMLRHFTRGRKKEVLISRGELVQIGGGFRIPEILEASGATLREVGATNHTTTDDYARALGPDTALLLKVHRSNFYQGGFTASPSVVELAALARKARVPFAEDLGSGALVATEGFLAAAAEIPAHERTPAEAIRDGVDVVCFSGDKLLGGPQAGILAGRTKTIAALKREPFFRALRCDKLILGALQATADLTLAGRHDEIPALAMMRVPEDALRARAERLAAALAGELPAYRFTVGRGRAEIGAGTLPRTTLASVTLDVSPAGKDGLTVNTLAARLRAGTPPVVAYVAAGRLKFDLRTVFPAQDETLLKTLRVATAD